MNTIRRWIIDALVGKTAYMANMDLFGLTQYGKITCKNIFCHSQGSKTEASTTDRSWIEPNFKMCSRRCRRRREGPNRRVQL